MIGNTEELLSQIDAAVRRAVHRMARSQHQDGGWGTQIEQSNFWHTAYALLFLNAARENLGAGVGREVEERVNRGMAFLEHHPECWAADVVSTVDSMSIYEISLMVRCFYRLGRSNLRRDSASRIYRGIDRLYHSQNGDGGWDANIWGYEVTTPIRIWSEVGGTSSALQALAETHNDRFQSVMVKGIYWLVNAQNVDGSWNDGSCSPILPPFILTGSPSIGKTCDALQGIFCGSALDIPLQPYRARVHLALDWLCQQITPILNKQDPSSGVGAAFTPADYENVCLFLETLMRITGVEHPQLASCAAWLVRAQRRQEDDPEDGSWSLGHTARIGLALSAYSRRLREGGRPEHMPWVL